MAALQDLPTETWILIIHFLGAFDLQTTVLAQRVSRKFRDIIQDVVFHRSFSTMAPADAESPYIAACSKVKINPLLRDKFYGLFDSADCFTVAERARYWVLTLDGDATMPFRRLPWATTVLSRDIFLRPEASWRGLSPTFGVAPRTRRLDVVKTFESDAGSPVSYSQVEIPESGLSMGLLYDILLCEETLYGPDTGSWQLLVGKSLKSFDVLYRWGCFIIDEPGESQLVSETPDAAILFVRGGEGCSETVLGRDEWAPQRLVKNVKPKFLPWQGPFIDPEETEWYNLP